jgi:hypothetical protein
MPDGSKYTYKPQQYAPNDNPLWIADYSNNSQTSQLGTVIIPDSLKFNNNGYIQFNGIGMIKSGNADNNCSIELGNTGTMYISSNNLVNVLPCSVTEMISGANQSINWSFNDLFRYQIDKSGFHPTEYTSNSDQWLGNMTFPWNGLVLNRNAYFLNMPQGNLTDKLLTLNSAGKVGVIQMLSGGGGNQQNVALDTIFCTGGIIVWNETGTTNKEVMISFENVTTQYTSFTFPIPLSKYWKTGDSNIVNNNDISPTNQYLKVEHLTNVTGFLYLKGY